MSYPINYPTPQGADIQIFQAPVRAVTTAWTAEWVKPQGASMVWFTLIGAGGGGGGVESTNAYYGAGGGSGAVTNCMIPAFLIPDVLQIRVGTGGTGGTTGTSGVAGTASTIFYQQKAVTGYTLLTANGGAGGAFGNVSNASPAAGGAASTSNFFSAAGFFQSVAGQDSVGGGTPQIPSPTTFLSGGAFDALTANYGYTAASGFQMQPIIVGAGRTSVTGGRGPTGCGGWSPVGFGACGAGGNGLVVIITW